MTLPQAPTLKPTLIVDYGLGNLLSLRRALDHIGVQNHSSNNPADIITADRIILPGVGSFSEASKSLHEGGFAKQIVTAARRGVPILGICLGMQLLFDEGHENGVSPGLGLMPGAIRRIITGAETSLPRTHIGWRSVKLKTAQTDGATGFKIPEGPFYFVHSFGAVPSESFITKATVPYAGHEIPAIVQKENILGVQFHPEKSRLPGQNLLMGFCVKDAGFQSLT